MHAHAAENLLSSLPADSHGGAILDVGSGSGYCKLYHAKVVGIEHIKELADWSKDNLRQDGIQVGEGGVEIIYGDGRLGELLAAFHDGP
jgi:protein-L-isoaspartate(D-aspartate) O-methyltransferase